MYNSAKVKEGLSGLVGFRQTHGTQFETLSTSLTDGVMFYLNDIHPMINIENLDACYKNAKQLGYEEWKVDKTYQAKERVRIGVLGFESLLDDNTGKDPQTENSYWKLINVLSEQIELSIKSSIDKLLQAVFVRKKLNSLVKSVLDDFYLYDGRADFNNKNANNGRFVGFRISLNHLKDIAVNVGRISFQIDTPSPDLKLYVYNTSDPNPIKVIPIDYNQDRAVKWFDLEAVNLTSPDGDYIIGYYESDLPAGAQSIKKETNLVDMPYCSSCNGRDYQLFKKRSKYMSIQPFYVDASNLNGTELWDESVEVYQERNNYGMNLLMTASCDLTDFIIRNKTLFAETLANQAAADILLAMQYSTNDNQLNQKIKAELNYALYGNKENYNKGLIADTEKSIGALSFDLSSLNPVCLPCNETVMVGRKVF